MCMIFIRSKFYIGRKPTELEPIVIGHIILPTLIVCLVKVIWMT